MESLDVPFFFFPRPPAARREKQIRKKDENVNSIRPDKRFKTQRYYNYYTYRIIVPLHN